MSVVLQRTPCLTYVTVPCANWDVVNSDPMTNVDDAREEFVQEAGEPPNRMVVSTEVHYALMRHPLVIDRLRHTSVPTPTLELLAAVFDVEEYVVEDVA
jgi:hypothetical protein